LKPNTNLIEVHPQLSNNKHPVDGALVGVGSLWPRLALSSQVFGHRPIYNKVKIEK
jgi:hypothetical protein